LLSAVVVLALVDGVLVLAGVLAVAGVLVVAGAADVDPVRCEWLLLLPQPAITPAARSAIGMIRSDIGANRSDYALRSRCPSDFDRRVRLQAARRHLEHQPSTHARA
jgi:hypothetical protein